MAAPKKKAPAKKTPAKKAPAKQASAKQAVPLQDAVSTLRGFQLYTLIGLGLFLAFAFFHLPDRTAFLWYLQVPLAVGAAGFLWHQTKQTTGLENTVCTYGLYAVIAAFVLRDIWLADIINDFQNWNFNNLFSMIQ